MRVSSYRVVGFPRRGFRSEIGRIRLPGMRVFRKNSGFSLLKCQVQQMRGLHILCYIYADLPSPETRIFFDTSNPATLSPEVSATPHPSVAFLSTDFDEFLAERRQILSDARALRHLAIAFLHPELPVVTSDAAARARCYFNRASAFEQESVEESEERAQILADSAALKERAIMYAHPELPVVTSDATATARCYFDRASATYDEEIVSTHAYSKAEKKEERLETTLQSLEALAESTGIKAPAASGPEARMPRSASNVQLFDLQDTA